MKLAVALFVSVVFCGLVSAQEPPVEPAYYSAQELETDCASASLDRRQFCRTLLLGVLGSLLYLGNTQHMVGVLCLPPMSAEDVRAHFLSFAIDRRQEIKDMLAASAVTDMLYQRYPCPAEADRRSAQRARAGGELLRRAEERQ